MRQPAAGNLGNLRRQPGPRPDRSVARMSTVACAFPPSTAAIAAFASEVNAILSPLAIASVRMPRSLSKNAKPGNA